MDAGWEAVPIERITQNQIAVITENINRADGRLTACVQHKDRPGGFRGSILLLQGYYRAGTKTKTMQKYYVK